MILLYWFCYFFSKYLLLSIEIGLNRQRRLLELKIFQVWRRGKWESLYWRRNIMRTAQAVRLISSKSRNEAYQFVSFLLFGLLCLQLVNFSTSTRYNDFGENHLQWFSILLLFFFQFCRSHLSFTSFILWWVDYYCLQRSGYWWENLYFPIMLGDFMRNIRKDKFYMSNNSLLFHSSHLWFLFRLGIFTLQKRRKILDSMLVTWVS